MADFTTNRYDKNVIEPFALQTIAISYDTTYADYCKPTDTDNFDYINPDETAALEVSMVFPENVKKAYVYEKEHSKNKRVSYNKIEGAIIRSDGSLKCYYGGTMRGIVTAIRERIDEKEEKAKKRMLGSSFTAIDLCLCIQEGSLFDLDSFKHFFSDYLRESFFRKIFFITASHFVVHDNEVGFFECERKIKNSNNEQCTD